ncbi:MAG: polymorphic toxin type 44 domain-containing protein [Chitinophagaceae bacterium]|nr:polymorphic toxin type 44 domain-containing protein [Chitinophagaceae bacterium]MCO5241277.1 polymorphic toxin type 44 domain-containing protein [Chitinophagaceae bacterium]
MVTITDKKTGVSTNGTTVDNYTPDVNTANDYYPGGMEMPGRTYTSGTPYRYSINGQEKTPEVAPNTTTAEFWQYDARIVRRWNVDPVIKAYESPYAAFGNNPVFLIDPKGEDTISINNKGKISNIISAKGNHVLLDYSNKQIQFNDPEYDTELINKRGVKVGDQLVHYLSESETKEKVDEQGTVYYRLMAKVLGEATPLGSSFYVQALRDIKEKSYKEWDFSHSVLGPLVNADPNSNLGKSVRSRGRTYVDDYKYEQYYFFVFGNTNKTYNLGDAGNFMWGMAGKRSGFTWIELKSGSNWNEIRQGRGLDSDADQKAIKSGFEMGGK